MELELDDNNYLKPEDIPQNGAVIKLLNEGVFVEKTFEDKVKKVLQFEIEFVTPVNLLGQQRIYTMNIPSQKAIRDVLGNNTKDWLDHELFLSTQKLVVKGTQRVVIYADVYKDGAAKTPAVNKLDVLND